MAYIQSTTPLDDNKETTGTSGALTTPALNSSGGDVQTTNNAATPQSSPAVIQPQQSAAQQGTGFVNLSTYLDKNQGSSQHLTSSLNNALDTANTAASTAVNAANSKPTTGNLGAATSAVNKATQMGTLAQDIGGRTQLLRNMSPTTINSGGLNLDQFLVQQNFNAGKVPEYKINDPQDLSQSSTGTSGSGFTGTPAVIEKPKTPPALSPVFMPAQSDMYKAQNNTAMQQLVHLKNNYIPQNTTNPAIFNPMAEVAPQGANYQPGWGVNYNEDAEIARTRQANATQTPAVSQQFNMSKMNTTGQPGMYNVNAAMTQTGVQPARISSPEFQAAQGRFNADHNINQPSIYDDPQIVADMTRFALDQRSPWAGKENTPEYQSVLAKYNEYLDTQEMIRKDQEAYRLRNNMRALAIQRGGAADAFDGVAADLNRRRS